MARPILCPIAVVGDGGTDECSGRWPRDVPGRKRNTIRIDAWAFVDITQPVSKDPIVEAEWMPENIRALVEKWLAADPSRNADRQ